MNDKEIKSKVISSLLWKFLERGGTQGIQFVVQILLARLLIPEDYGIIALIAVYLTLANVFIQSGLSIALIQKKDADETDFSSVFYMSLLIAIIVYLIIFFTAPLIARFYNVMQLVPVLRVVSFTLFLGVFNSIQNAIIARNMLFKKLFLSSSGAVVISGTVGIILAYRGFGVWSLVAQQLTNQLMITIILWFTVKWRPRLLFSFQRVEALFAFGWKLLVSSLIDTLYMNLRSLIIGKIYSPAMLGYYNRGDQFPHIIVTNINGSIQSVMLPALVSQQENKQRVKDMVRRSIITSSYLLFPLMAGLAIVAKPLVIVVLTEKWLPSVPFLQIFCASYALWPIHTANLQAINALGRSDIFLKLEIIKKIMGLTILGISIYFGIYAIAIGALISGVISTFINAYPNLKLLNYSYKEQMKDLMPSLLLSLIMSAIIYTITFLLLSPMLTLILQIVAGALLYIGMSILFQLESFQYLVATFKSMKSVKKEVVI